MTVRCFRLWSYLTDVPKDRLPYGMESGYRIVELAERVDPLQHGGVKALGVSVKLVTVSGCGD